ncbi:hypothetical protein RXV94_04130 [Yeosuana sp. MJ-SS3]|jgi:uncharacterized membrane protein|uniref:DUF502 domain-containing protein n=1 Tax=Gilvirhabdus luticola TaxID=3079858 RepID=A0ABU3U4J3_9FLAO|nr:hypothetical protein [Yeosuana sp. MJ-SS3]MDU8885337.1 hypothetical protein [Yeosuana sp. MJ-SS3]
MSILKKSTRSMIVGGLFFMVPLLLVLVVTTKIFQIVLPFGRKISNVLDLHSVFGKASVTIVCIILILLICLISGLLIEKGFVKKWSNSVEEKLFIHFPSLQMLKYRLIGDKKSVINELWQAVLVYEDGGYSIAFITESTEKFVTLFFPDAPKIDAGQVKYIPKEEFKYIPITMKEAMSSLYSFGKNMNIEKMVLK